MSDNGPSKLWEGWGGNDETHRDCRAAYDAKCAELVRTKELLCEFLTEADQVAWFDEPEDKQFERALSWVKSFHALRAEVERLAEELQRTNGTASLAIQHRDAAETKIERLRAVLVMMYDKWEDGTPCHDEHDIFVGNAFQLTQAEEDSVLALIPADRAALAADVDDCPHGPRLRPFAT